MMLKVVGVSAERSFVDDSLNNHVFFKLSSRSDSQWKDLFEGFYNEIVISINQIGFAQVIDDDMIEVVFHKSRASQVQTHVDDAVFRANNKHKALQEKQRRREEKESAEKKEQEKARAEKEGDLRQQLENLHFDRE